MADCDDALTSLYQYLDRELEDASSSAIRSHLEQCSECFHAFDFEGRLRQVVKDRLQENVPDEFMARLRSAIAREEITDC